MGKINNMLKQIKKMRKTIIGNSNCLFIAFLLFCILGLSCSKDEYSFNGSNTTTNIEDKLNISDITGVWIIDSYYNNGSWEIMPSDLYFLSITENGFYSYCFNKRSMGSGEYSLKNNVITLNNNYFLIKDSLKLSLNNEELLIEGSLTLFTQNQKEYFKLKLKKTDEKISPSVVGTKREPQLYGINIYYEDVKMIVSYLTNYTASYEYTGIQKSTGKRKTLKSYSWYYIYRAPYTYTQEIGGNGEIIIYNFEDMSPSDYLKNNIVKQPIL